MLSIFAMISPFVEVINVKPIYIEEICWTWLAIKKKQIVQMQRV